MRLHPRDAARLQLLLPLLASPHDGEVIATRNAICRMLKSAGCDWHDLAAACVPIAVEADVETSPLHRRKEHKGGASFGDIARACRDRDLGQLTPRERAFVADMVRRGFAFRPSPRQTGWLASIFDRLSARDAA